MKNSIMKKTWGILLGFGLSLATAAFVLTGCVIEEDDSIAVSLKVTSVGNAVRVEITSGNAVWDSSYITGQANAGSYGVRGVFDFTLTGSGTAPNAPIPRAVSGDDTKLDFVYTLGSWSGIAKVSTNGMTAGYLGTYLNDLNGNSYVFDDFVVTITHDPTDGVPLPASSTGGGGGGTATIEDLVTALGSANVNVDTTAKTVTLKANITNPASFTVPSDVKLIVGNSGNKLTLPGGKTFTIEGTLQTTGGQLLLGTSGTITINGGGTIEKTSGTAEVLYVNGATVNISDVTVKGLAGSSAPVIIVQSGSLTLDNAKVTGNTGNTGLTGAGIKINAGTVTLDNGAEVSGNDMTQNTAKGAGVYLAGGTLNIKGGSTVYGYSTWGATYELAEAASDYALEGANANSVPASSTAYGSAIYWASGATVNVPKTGGTLESILTAWANLDTSDQNKFRYIESPAAPNASDHYTDFTIHTDANQWWNIAAR